MYAVKNLEKTFRIGRVQEPMVDIQKGRLRIAFGKTRRIHYVHTNGSSMVLPIMEDGTILLVNQYRYLLNRESLEFPCGSVKAGFTYDETAQHELMEETGYSAKILTRVGEFNPYNGMTIEMCLVYIARGLHYVGGTPDETEEFEMVRAAPAEIDARIAAGLIWDGMTIAAWTIAKLGRCFEATSMR